MSPNRSILLIGFIPELVDFSEFPGMTAERVRTGLAAQQVKLKSLGYDSHELLIDLGATAEAAVAEKLAEREYACVLIGAGVRTSTRHFLLFERLLNVLHAGAPRAKICVNSNPGDSLEAFQRWVPLG
jgi:hypothetical protein